MDPARVLTVLAIGAGVGFLGGLFGKGGSAIATPLLAAIGIPPIVAVASPLPATIPGTLAASGAYWRAGLVDWRVWRWSLAWGAPATVAGAIATRWIDGGALVAVTDVIVAGLGFRLILAPHEPREVVTERPWYRTRLATVSVVVGVASGLLANSGGFLLAPLYVTVLGLEIKPAFASSLLVAAVLAVPGTIVHAALGHVDWTVVAVFGIASVPLSFAGARVTLRTRAALMERVYGAVLTVLGLGLLALR